MTNLSFLNGDGEGVDGGGRWEVEEGPEGEEEEQTLVNMQKK